jgi:hypothetical protein
MCSLNDVIEEESALGERGRRQPEKKPTNVRIAKIVIRVSKPYEKMYFDLKIPKVVLQIGGNTKEGRKIKIIVSWNSECIKSLPIGENRHKILIYTRNNVAYKLKLPTNPTADGDLLDGEHSQNDTNEFLWK